MAESRFFRGDISAPATLDDKGRCCGRKPLTYKREGRRFCDRCFRSYHYYQDFQMDNWAWKRRTDGQFEYVTGTPRIGATPVMTTKPQSTTTKLEVPEPTLEPCKFCGRRSKIEEFFIDDDPRPWYVATCELCPVTTYDQTTPEEAARIWNTRVSANTVPTVDQRPKIICLCGSTRFIEQFAITTWELERLGHIVLGCTLLPMWYCKTPSHFGEATGTKEQCDELHLRKIDLADEVLVLNIGGYVGESTRNEIAYATRISKPVRYLESESVAAASPVAPQQSEDDEPQHHAKTCDRWVQCGDHVHYEPIVNCSCTAPAPSAAIQDEAPTFRSTKEAMLYAQRHGIPSVIPAKSSYSEGVDDAARVAPLRTALDEIEVALISIADGVSPQEAVGKAFNIINHERSKLNAAASERCLSKGEALTLDEVQE